MNPPPTPALNRGVNPMRRARVAAFVAVALAATLLALLADRWAYDHLWQADVYDHDWARLLRVMGFLPTWLAAAYALWLQQRVMSPPRARRRALTLALAPAIAGAGAEVLKLLIRRERPEAHAGGYALRAWSEQTFSTAGLAMPSSHTMVAFGAAAALCRLYPRARWVWIALAIGCGVTRVIARAHFVSDAVLGAAAGWGIGILMARALAGPEET
jgi:membrane-associated phospholipid phosphatase